MTTQPNVGDIWYRYEDRCVSLGTDEWGDSVGSRVELQCHELTVVRLTPKGVWLSRCVYFSKLEGSEPASSMRSSGARFVCLSSRKQYGSPTKEAALVSYVARKDRQARILQGQLNRVGAGRDLARCELAKLQGEVVRPNLMEELGYV